jgi:pyruvate kinase
MNKTSDLVALETNDHDLSAIAKLWGAVDGEKVLVVRNADIREITVA